MQQSLSGRTILFFIALDYHLRYLRPVIRELEKRGATVEYFTAPAEAGFEKTLIENDLPFMHLLDFLDASGAEEVRQAMRGLRDAWIPRLFQSPTLQAVPLPIQDKVIQLAAEASICTRNMLEERRPDAVFALHELNSWGKALGYWADHFKMPYITFQEGLCYAPTPLYQFHTEYCSACITWGEADSEVLKAAGGDPERIYPLGNMELFDAKQQLTIPGNDIRSKVNLDYSKKMILFLAAYAPYTPFLPMDFLKWLDANPDVEVFFKWHPLMQPQDVAPVLQNLQHPRIHSVCGGVATELIAMSDVCVLIGNSTTGIEALAFDKPLIEVPLLDMHYRYAEHGVCAVASGFEDLPQVIGQILQNGVPADRQAAVEKYLRYNFAHQTADGPCRVVDLLEDLLQK